MKGREEKKKKNIRQFSQSLAVLISTVQCGFPNSIHKVPVKLWFDDILLLKFGSRALAVLAGLTPELTALVFLFAR